ncbi:MAG TPA: undecaprenyldiphospho-muramoylpentapeptide beta-N-acetylglucosaminyltransferase [Geminicoccaceae bacterium]
MSARVVLAAGGTGGHMFPAVAVESELRRRGLRPLIVCDRRGARFLDPAAGHRTVSAASPSGGLRRRIGGGLRLLLGTLQSVVLLLRDRPSAALCFGGYAALPVAVAARVLGVPVVVHEQNAVLGRTNRLAGGGAAALALTFEDTSGMPDRPNGRCVITGNPVRPEVQALAGAAYAAPDRDGPFRLVVVGGSQGARSLSEVVPEAIAALGEDLRARLVLTQQCRPEDLTRVRAAYHRIGLEASLASFFSDLPERLATAHLVISRSGASSVAELLVLGRPSILVPYRHAADDHQRANAEALVLGGAAWILPEDELDSGKLARLLEQLARSPDRLAGAARRAQELARPDAASALADVLIPLLDRRAATRDREVLA